MTLAVESHVAGLGIRIRGFPHNIINPRLFQAAPWLYSDQR